MTVFNMVRDVNGYNGFGLPISNNKYSALLLTDTEDTVTVPQTNSATYKNVLAIFSFEEGRNVWVAVNATAAYPSGSFSATDSERRPTARSVKPGDVISMITSDTSAQVGVVFYAVL